MNKYVFKICSYVEWKKALKIGFFQGSFIDKKDGFIHFSAISQVKETLEIHFKNIHNLCILKIYTNELKIVWEEARNGESFPHLYNTFKVTNVHKVYPLTLNEDGTHALPNLNNT